MDQIKAMVNSLKYNINRNLEIIEKEIEVVRGLLNEHDLITLKVEPHLKPVYEYLQYYLVSLGKKTLVLTGEETPLRFKSGYLKLEIKGRKRIKFSFSKNNKLISDMNLEGFKPLYNDAFVPLLTILVRLQEIDVRGTIEKFYNRFLEEFDPPSIGNFKKFLLKEKRAFCLGRGISYPIAIEICSILRNSLHIHAESYPAGESKHGPIALIEENFPVFQIIAEEKIKKKVLNSLMEMKARGARIITITHLTDREIFNNSDVLILVPNFGINDVNVISLGYLIGAIFLAFI